MAARTGRREQHARRGHERLRPRHESRHAKHAAGDGVQQHHGGGIFRSTDSGATWTRVSTSAVTSRSRHSRRQSLTRRAIRRPPAFSKRPTAVPRGRGCSRRTINGVRWATSRSIRRTPRSSMSCTTATDPPDHRWRRDMDDADPRDPRRNRRDRRRPDAHQRRMGRRHRRDVPKHRQRQLVDACDDGAWR